MRNCFKMVVVGLSCVYWIACVPSGINKEINFVEICSGASDNHSRKTICGSVCESDRSRLLIRSGISGRPKDNNGKSTCPNGLSSLRKSNVIAYDKDSCIICQIPTGKLHKVEYMNTGRKMLEVAHKLNDKSFYLHLNTIPNAADAVANDVSYHLKCWVNVQRKAGFFFNHFQFYYYFIYFYY